jgi:predicted PurR-regulated permease PerM
VDLEFSPAQRRALAAALTTASVLFILAVIVALFLGMILLVQGFSHIFFPLAVSAVLALLLKPYHTWCRRLTGDRAALAVGLVYLSIGLPLCLAAALLGLPVLHEVRGFVEHIPQWIAAVRQFLQQNVPALLDFWQSHHLTEKLKGFLSSHSGMFTQGMQQVGAGAFSVGSRLFQATVSLFSWVLVPVYVAFLLLLPRIRAETVEERLLPFLKPETSRDVIYLAREFAGIIVAFFRGQLLIALLQGVLFALGFFLAGLQYGLVLGFLAGFLNIIPYLGSLVGAGITLPLAFFQPGGGVWTLLWVGVVFVVVQAVEGNVLTPRIMGDQTGLHPLLIMVAVLFWGSVFGGILGMILAIPLTAFIAVVWRLLREKYIRAVL